MSWDDLEILEVERLDLYERFGGQEFYKIPASKKIWGRYVLPKLFLREKKKS
jgi:hypothetical protein